MSSAMTSASRLAETQRVMNLSGDELAGLFGVDQGSIARWLCEGVPPDRRASVDGIHKLLLALGREVLASRIPEIVRRSDPWLADRSILTAMHAEGVDPIWRYLIRLFAYAE